MSVLLPFVKHIIVHHGQAHRDDFIAASLTLSLCNEGVTIERRDPTDLEMTDFTVLVLDVGGEHDPEMMNFDHHQFPREHAPACALSLLIEHLDLKAFNLLDWYESTIIMDSKGPFELAKSLGLSSPESIFKTISPIESTLLEMFEEDPQGMAPLMQQIGKRILKQAKDAIEGLAALKSSCKAIQVKGLEVLVFETKEIKHAQKLRDTEYSNAVASISLDDRGEGYTIYRFNDDPRIDLSRLEGNDDILFAHAGGFIAKTKTRKADPARLLSLCIIS